MASVCRIAAGTDWPGTFLTLHRATSTGTAGAGAPGRAREARAPPAAAPSPPRASCAEAGRRSRTTSISSARRFTTPGPRRQRRSYRLRSALRPRRRTKSPTASASLASTPASHVLRALTRRPRRGAIPRTRSALTSSTAVRLMRSTRRQSPGAASATRLHRRMKLTVGDASVRTCHHAGAPRERSFLFDERQQPLRGVSACNRDSVRRQVPAPLSRRREDGEGAADFGATVILSNTPNSTSATKAHHAASRNPARRTRSMGRPRSAATSPWSRRLCAAACGLPGQRSDARWRLAFFSGVALIP